jgi:hypothetical protein
MVVRLSLEEAHLCGNVECNTISNRRAACPGCTSQTVPLSRLLGNPATQLAHEIARDSAQTDVDSFTLTVERDGVIWHDIDSSMPDQERDYVMRAVRYLEVIGALVRHEQNANLIRWE